MYPSKIYQLILDLILPLEVLVSSFQITPTFQLFPIMLHYIPLFIENSIIFYSRYPHNFSIQRMSDYIPKLIGNSIISFHGILFRE